MKKNVKYAVIILNYNTINDAIRAAESVIKNAKSDDYIICLADGASTKQYDRDLIKSIKIKNVVTVQLHKNDGYAKGNNRAIEFILSKYKPQYVVIMNPDVYLIEEGTIDNLIERIEQSNSRVVGAQPLVWNYRYGDDARYQQNIRKVQDYFEVCLSSFYPLRLIFGDRYKDMTYMNKVPYEEEILFYVPSGAFFIINTDFFLEVNMFDENTFLYYEEYILGYKLKEKGYKLLFSPQYRVKHAHGKSTGYSRYSVNEFGTKKMIESKCYYASKYLRVGKVKIFLIWILNYLDYYLKKLFLLIKFGKG